MSLICGGDIGLTTSPLNTSCLSFGHCNDIDRAQARTSAVVKVIEMNKNTGHMNMVGISIPLLIVTVLAMQ